MTPEHTRVLRPLCDRIGRERVDRVIARFYERLRTDAQLAPFFARVRDFPEHERRIADFWWIAMGGKVEAPAPVDMLGLHRPMGLRHDDLERWLALFDEVLDAELDPELAQQWRTMARGIGQRLARAVIA
jgi:hemoglobin